MIGVGLDFGTSNSAAAWFDGKKVHLVQLEKGDAIMPTATHLDRDLATAAADEGWEVQTMVTDHPGHEVGLATQAVRDGWPVGLAAGGGGTVAGGSGAGGGATGAAAGGSAGAGAPPGSRTIPASSGWRASGSCGRSM